MSFVSHRHIDLRGFWGDVQRRTVETTIPYQWEALNDRVPGADKSGAVKNIRIAAGKAAGSHHGFVFQDSDLAKWIEAVAYASEIDAGREKSRELLKIADRVIRLLELAQDDDGYLNSAFTIKDRDKRWADLRDNHEMYVSGHLLEAAIAYFKATGKRRFLDVMLRNVDLIARRFGRGKGKARGYPGHPELELALVRLYGLTGERRHLDLASYFIDERGRTPRYFDREARRLGKTDFRSLEWYALYNQSHAPIREQREVVGHAVRAGYLYAAAAAVARETGDRELSRAVKRLWRNATERKMYLTGGVGSTLLGEAFTFDYDLPNEWAYTETCAAIALVFWGRRMLDHEIDSRYGDVIERALFNNILAALSIDGTHCFYRNPLADVPDPKYPKRHVRRPWHECACCPPNLSRFLTSLGSYAYSAVDGAVFAHLYMESTAELQVKGSSVRIEQRTDYPWEGSVSFEFQLEASARFTFGFRIPGWAREAGVTVNGEPVDAPGVTRRGYARLNRLWRPGDRVEIDFPMPIERVRAHGRVRQDAGRVALQRGPVVFCLEQADNGRDLHEIILPEDAQLVVREAGRAGGMPEPHRVIEGRALRRRVDTSGLLYTQNSTTTVGDIEIRAIPYYLWANRGMGEMTVWIREVSHARFSAGRGTSWT